jgi:UDP-N-acetylmuramoylalanine--D-glutamate ligase
MLFNDLQHARVAILGMGREGQAVWRQLRKRFPEKPLSIFTESAVDDDIARQLDSRLDECHAGPFDVAELSRFDVLVRSAGISPYRAELRQLRALGLQFTSASEPWFAENPEAKTICISGTMGKSTTAALASHLLDCAGVSNCLAGNIGRPMLDCENGDIDWWIIELSSYQLSDLKAVPGVALLLNLSEEHVDWHGGVDQYHADKLKLAELAAGGTVIANYSDPVLAAKLAERAAVSWFNHADAWMAGDCGVTGASGVYVAAPASLPGRHNMQNLAAVLTVFDKLGIEVPRLEEALSAFTGLPHRLQLIGERESVRYVDDSISTTPMSVSAALQTLGHEGVILLLGGMDRGLDWNRFAMELKDRTPHAIITLPDNGPKIFDCLKRAGIEPSAGLHQVDNLADAVALARTLAPEKGCILLSPGAPSFPFFRDFEDRGNQFKKFAGIEKGTWSAH